MKAFYAVAVGKQPGIYDNWDEAKDQVNAFPGAKYKGFNTYIEAVHWMKEQGKELGEYHICDGALIQKELYTE